MFWVFKTNNKQCEKEYVNNFLITITVSVNLSADGCLNLSLKDGNYLELLFL